MSLATKDRGQVPQAKTPVDLSACSLLSPTSFTHASVNGENICEPVAGRRNKPLTVQWDGSSVGRFQSFLPLFLPKISHVCSATGRR